jgi:hypothetical protein
MILDSGLTQINIGTLYNAILSIRPARLGLLSIYTLLYSNMANTYKTLKEEFVSNLSGGDINEINHVTSVAPVRSSTCLKALD